MLRVIHHLEDKVFPVAGVLDQNDLSNIIDFAWEKHNESGNNCIMPHYNKVILQCCVSLIWLLSSELSLPIYLSLHLIFI